MEEEGERQVGWRTAVQVLTCIFSSWKVSVGSVVVEFLLTVHYHCPPQHTHIYTDVEASTSEPECFSLLTYDFLSR